VGAPQLHERLVLHMRRQGRADAVFQSDRVEDEGGGLSRRNTRRKEGEVLHLWCCSGEGVFGRNGDAREAALLSVDLPCLHPHP